MGSAPAAVVPGVRSLPCPAGPSPAATRRSRASRFADDDEHDGGYSVVEAVITLPVLIVLTMLVVQYALLWHGRNVAESAAQDGLRAARAYQGSPAMGENSALSYLAQVAPQLLTDPKVHADRTGTTVTVQVRAQVTSILGFGTFNIQESAAGPVEKFVAPTAAP